LPQSEYEEWREFYQLGAWGVTVQDSMSAQLAQILANVNRDRSKRPTPYSLADFMLYRDREPERAPMLEAEHTASGIQLKDVNQQTELLIAQFSGATIFRAVPPKQ